MYHISVIEQPRKRGVPRKHSEDTEEAVYLMYCDNSKTIPDIVEAFKEHELTVSDIYNIRRRMKLKQTEKGGT